MPALLLEARKVGSLGEEVGVRALQILERLLQRMDGRIRQPGCIGAVAPYGEFLAQPRVAELLLTALVEILLQSQGLVVDEAARTSEAAHQALLFAGLHQFKLEGLEALHDWTNIQPRRTLSTSALSFPALNGGACRAPGQYSDAAPGGRVLKRLCTQWYCSGISSTRASTKRFSRSRSASMSARWPSRSVG
ncbi:hypothetical protein GALL_358660 [mine drainage metagenome]|uniref:Uncharacterized protein n=1 Tax=mine drainage metagenome TaxID=410659 RepID=A0A1J5R2G7_9ZZZZ